MTQERVLRRLAAILAADVVDYSRLMGLDEAGTRDRFNAVLDEIVRPAIAEHRGRLFKTMGDGLLVEFASVVDAVDCAVRIQTDLKRRAAHDPDPLRMRIGVNMGDVIIEGDDVHGDGVNVAARIEALAEPGGVSVSRSARDQIRDKLAYAMEDMGEVQVKNIARPVRVFKVRAAEPRAFAALPVRGRVRVAAHRLRLALAAGLALALVAAGLVLWFEPWAPRVEAASLADMRLPLPDKPSVAVLPFDVLSAGAGDRAFADAINEDLTRGLAQISGIFVIARGSTLAYIGENARPAKAAEELGVRHVVRASVRREGNRVRINADLADAVSGRIVWSERFDRASDDLFALQDELVQALASRLASDLSKIGEQRRFTSDVEAYFNWFEGDRESWLNTPTSLGKARALALAALDRDPDFVRAKALLAFVETQTGYFKMADDPAAALARAESLAAAATGAQPDDWYARAVYAHSMMNVRRYAEAATAYDEAVELDPANAALLTRSTLPLIFLGRGADAEARLRVSIRLNPYHDWLPDQLLGQALYIQEKYAEAIEHLSVARRKNPRFIGNMWWRAAAYGQLGKAAEAAEAVTEILARMPDAGISKSFIQISDPDAMGRFREGLRAAGLPK